MSTFSNFYDIPNDHYGVIYADPPWTFVTRSVKGKGRSPEQHYSCLSVGDIMSVPVWDKAAQDAVLLLWVPDPHLKLGMEVMEALGFIYKTVAFTWVKRNKKATPYKLFEKEAWTDDQFFTGMGYYTRANPEMCLLGTRGHPQRLHKDVRQLLLSKRREHSRKPDEAYGRIERLLPGPYLELFGRTTAPGWDVWGDQTDKFVSI